MLPRHNVLDLGCGAGVILLWMHMAGYPMLTGADPFLPEERELAPGVRLMARGHDQLNGRFDWIMMHHSFEHVPDPGATLSSAARLLAPGGRVLIRMPITGTAAWRAYGVNWAQLDAPRHLTLLTLPAIHMLC